MLDCVVRGGEVIDGTGRPRRRADVGIRDGRIVAIGDVSEEAEQTIDASGWVVAPGFVDIHTHYDAQAFWDTTLSPSPLHGVTTVIGGNCGFTIAPLAPGDGDYLMHMLARVEGMPLESLAQGRAVGLDDVRRVPRPARRHARGERRVPGRPLGDPARRDGRATRPGDDATPGEQYEMERLLARRPRGRRHGLLVVVGHDPQRRRGRPGAVAPRVEDELLALCKVVSAHEGTTLEFIPTIGLFEEHDIELMTHMSLAANRPLNWNVLQVNSRERRDHREQAVGERLRVRPRRTRAGAHDPRLDPHPHLASHRLPPRRAQRMGEADGAAARREDGAAGRPDAAP